MYYNKQIQEILEEFQTTKNGLDENAVTASRDKYGENKLYEKKKKECFYDFP